MISSSTNQQLLESYLASFDIAVSTEQSNLLLRHLDLVVEKNKVMNLTRIVDPKEAIIRHVVDSLLLLPSLSVDDTDSNVSFVDIGTGAGFPGIPVAVLTGYHGLLIDSVGKKVNAVSSFIKELGLDAQVQARHVRAEELARDLQKPFSFVIARAVADMGVLVEYASPLLASSGKLVISKGNLTDEELSRGCKTGELVGLTYVSRETFELPEEQGHREILTFIHDHESKVALPRPNGIAKSKPLVP